VGEKRNQVNKVTVTIYNEDYIVKGTEKPDYIEMLASYVDRRMRMVQQRNVNLSTSKVAVLTALNLANELNKLQEDYDELVKTLEEERKNRMGSRADAGSSIRITSGLTASTRAITSRCCCPPDSLAAGE
jgi:cell division protein ZapA